MKWLSAKYAYPLVILSLLVSIGLQAAWLRQLFLEQRQRTREDLEAMLASATKDNIYANVSSAEPNEKANFRQFLLSPAWLQIKQGFDDALAKNISKTFMESDNEDSSSITLRLVFYKSRPVNRNATYDYEMPMSEALRQDSLSYLQMKKRVTAELRTMGITKHYRHVRLPYVDRRDTAGPAPSKAAFASIKRSYNLFHRYRYQLIIDSLNSVIWYKMRYFLASSILMLLLTGAAFYFILKLMRQQRLYAEARASFTSNMTHEIKTPIATVALAIESIGKYHLANDPAKLQTYLDMSRQELHRLSLMVEKILNLDQGSHGGDYQLKPVLYDIQANLQEVLDSMELQFSTRNARYHFTPSPEPCFIYGDAVHLTSVCYNLIENALKYADKPLVLDLSCHCTTEEVTITFTDNGPGIAPVYHDKIFDRYFRVPPQGDRHNVKGSGLGLNYVKQIIELHKGRITVKSEPGKGSTFIIHLPAAA